MLDVNIRKITKIDEYVEPLCELLIDGVEGGASIGFLSPISKQDALDYWNSVEQPDIILLIASVNEHIVGSVQLHLCMKDNGNHRAEVAKLMTHSQYRRHGVGRALMKAVEEYAAEEKRSLLVLDTRAGDPSNLLYQGIGYQFAGTIPNFAKSSNGELDGTNLYYKELS